MALRTKMRDICAMVGSDDETAEMRRVQLRAFISKRRIKIREWARDAGLGSDGTIRNFLSGATKSMTQGTIEALAKAQKVRVSTIFPEIHPAMQDGIDENPVGRKKRGIDSIPSDDAHFPTGVIKVPQVDIRAGLGGGGEVASVNDTDDGGYTVSKDALHAVWGVPDGYLGELGVSRNGIFFFRVLGDSMQRPDGSGIHSGDIVLADTLDCRPSPPGIFALWDGLGTVVKRVEYIMNSEPARVKIRSDNPNHESYERTLEEVKIIGRCVWYGRRL